MGMAGTRVAGTGAVVEVHSHWTRTLSNQSSPRLLPRKTRALTRTQHSMSSSRHFPRWPATGVVATEAVVAALAAALAAAVAAAVVEMVVVAEVGIVVEREV